jgi:ankyrin repeat protein
VVRRHGAEVVVRYKERGATKQGTFELPSPLLRVPGETQSGFTPLMCACTLDVGEHAAAITRELLAAGASAPLQDSDGYSALHWAAMAVRPPSIHRVPRRVVSL